MLLADFGHVLMTLLFTRLNGFAAWAHFVLARRPPEPIPQEGPHGFFFAGTGSQSEFLITDGLALVGIGTPAASMTR